MLTEGAKRHAATKRGWKPPIRSPHTRWWTLSRSEGKRTEILAVLRRGEKVLPVFGHEEEAELYLWLAGLGEGWRVRESRCGELVSVLCGPCADVKSVALDPLPQMIEDGTLALSCWSRREFVRALTGGSGHEARTHDIRHEPITRIPYQDVGPGGSHLPEHTRRAPPGSIRFRGP